MRTFILGLLVSCFCLGLASCAGSVSTALPIEVLITTALPDDTVQVGTGSVVFQAEVLNDPHHGGVKWTLTVANVPCSPACGTLTTPPLAGFTTTYTPPTQAPLNEQATITATSVDNPASDDALLFTIIPPTSVTITNKFTTQYANGPSITVDATVANDLTGSGVSWTLTAGGANCSPACGTLTPSAAPSFTAVYMPPPTVPMGSSDNPTIMATSVEAPAASDSFSFMIDSPLALMKGSYVFLLRGYDSSQLPMAMAGVITFDGNGNITSGELDFDDDGGINHVAPPATGTYTVDPSFNGITRVAVEISSFTFPNSNVDLHFHFVLSQDGTRGHIIELDGSGYMNSGTIALQSSSAISNAPSGNFAFGLDSDAPVGGRIVAAGQLQIGAGGITGGLIDQSKAGNASPIYSDQAISAGPVSAPDANGRGTMSMTVSGVTTQYAYYIVDSSHFRLVEIDQGLTYGTVQAGSAILQDNLTANSVNATSVLQFAGMDEYPGTNTPGPDVIIGVMTIAAGAFNMTFDSNDLGNVVTSNPAAGVITSFDPTSGRAVLSYPGGFEQGFVDSATIYMYDQGAGFIIDTDISTPNGTPPNQAITNNAFSGTLTQQTGAPFANPPVSGNLIAGFGASAVANVPNWDIALTATPPPIGPTPYAAIGDLTSLPSQDGFAINGQFSGVFGNLSSKPLGYGLFTMPATIVGDFTSGKTVIASYYFIAPNQFVSIGVTNGEISGISFFDPQ